MKTVPPAIEPTEIGTPLETKLFRTRKVDYTRQSARDKRIGRAGELLVLDYERQALVNAGLPELAEKVRHVAEVEGDGAGYDIESYESDSCTRSLQKVCTKLTVHPSFAPSLGGSSLCISIRTLRLRPTSLGYFSATAYSFVVAGK